MNLALTAYGTENGTAYGKTPTSPGNVFVATYVEDSSQHWTFWEGSSVISYSENQIVQDDIYYINNKYSGMYLYNDGYSYPSMASGLISQLGNTIRWNIQKVNGGYVIQSTSEPSKYLAVPTNTSSNSVYLETCTENALHDRFKWNITIASGGGVLIRNIYNLKYLYISGSTLYTSSYTGTAGTDEYKQRVWRIIDKSSYGPYSYYSHRELGSTDNFNMMKLFPNESGTPTLNSSNVLWANPEDFVFTSQNPNIAEVNNTTGTIIAKNYGTATIEAYHKVTGREKTFTVIVCKYIAVVNNYFDYGYAVFRDETLSEAKDSINLIIRKVSDRFAELCGLKIATGLPTYFPSAIDSCKGTVTISNLNDLCEHTNKESVVSDFGNYVSGSNVITNVLWTMHKIKTNEPDEYNRPFAIASFSQVYILDRTTVEEYLFVDLMHELCHIFGVPDHYHRLVNGECINKEFCSICGDNKRPRECRMFETSVYTDFILCAACQADLIAHLNDHHQPN